MTRYVNKTQPIARNMRRLLIRHPYSCGSAYSLFSDKKLCRLLVISQQPVVSLSKISMSHVLNLTMGAPIADEMSSRIFLIHVDAVPSPWFPAVVSIERAADLCECCCNLSHISTSSELFPHCRLEPAFLDNFLLLSVLRRPWEAFILALA